MSPLELGLAPEASAVLGARALGAHALGARPLGAHALGARPLGAHALGARPLGAHALEAPRDRLLIPPLSPSGSTEEETGTATEVATDTRTQLARPWNVVVWDDPITLMTYVTQVFQKVFGYSATKCERLMMEVHNEGRSIVWTGAREQAEVYTAKLQSHYLKTTLEQVEG